MQPAPEPHGRSDGLHLVFLASPLAVRDNLAQMLAAPPLRDLSPDARGTAELVLAEVLNNIGEHAYPDGPGPVWVTLTAVADGTQCLVVDQGIAMPHERLPVGQLPSTDTALEDLPEGGFGWHLIHSLTHDLTYLRTGGCNRLSFLLPQA
ncbi:MAG: ATP-binding protein [Pseudomonadota bacterium]